MKVVDLEGNITDWKLKACSVSEDMRPRSSYHVKARKLIKQIFPTSTLLEEVPIKTEPRQTLYLDFYMPLYQIAIEVHGAQHFKYTTHFHKNKMAYILQLKRDRQKQEWCSLNNIQLTVLKYNEAEDEWTRKLKFD